MKSKKFICRYILDFHLIVSEAKRPYHILIPRRYTYEPSTRSIFEYIDGVFVLTSQPYGPNATLNFNSLQFLYRIFFSEVFVLGVFDQRILAGVFLEP